jgi:hypothetical protein
MFSSQILQEVSYSTVLATVVAFLFAFYGPKLVTEMPDSVRVVFENNLARFAMMVLIVYLGNHNLQLSLVISVCIILIMSYVHRYEIKEELSNKIHEDFYTNSPISEPYQNRIEQFVSGNPQLHLNPNDDGDDDGDQHGLIGEGGKGQYHGGEEEENGDNDDNDNDDNDSGLIGGDGKGQYHGEEEGEKDTPDLIGVGGKGQYHGEGDGPPDNTLHLDDTHQQPGDRLPDGNDHESFVNYRMNQLQQIENSVQSMVNNYKMIG